MRHSNRIKKFGRVRKQRTSLLKTLLQSLFRDGRIKTTEAKAKAVRPFAERLITTAKKETIASKRIISSRLGNSSSAVALCALVKKKFSDRSSGYTRVVKTGFRKSDGARMAVIEFV